MNYLAHFVLSHDQPEMAFGNFMTDMMTIYEIREWPDTLQDGVRLHRYIDDFTDSHPINKNIRILLRPYFQKYAGVALDLYYDYMLYKHWERWMTPSFSLFSQNQYEIIHSFEAYIPARLHGRIMRMTEAEFLKTYTTVRGQAFAFNKMDQRSSFETGFSKAADLLPVVMDDLDKAFQSFFPEILEATQIKIKEGFDL